MILTKLSGFNIVLVGGKLFGVILGDVVNSELDGWFAYVVYVGDCSWAEALVVQISLLFPVPSTERKL